MFANTSVINSFLKAISPLPDRLGSLERDDTIIGLDEMLYHLREIDSSADIKFGVTKMVIIADSLKNVVIKIPFNGTYNIVENNDDDYDEYSSILDNYEWYDFSYAPSKVDDSDYCLVEFEMYRALKKQKLHSFVAKTVFYMMWEGYRIFLQEKVIPFCDYFDTSKLTPITQKEIDSASSIPFRRGRSEWLAHCIQTYGEKKTKRFFSYCENENPDIVGDFHTGNYGYRPNGTPCILDYSNYCE